MSYRICYQPDNGETRCTVLGDFSKHWSTREEALAALRSMPTCAPQDAGRVYWIECVDDTDQAHDEKGGR